MGFTGSDPCALNIIYRHGKTEKPLKPLINQHKKTFFNRKQCSMKLIYQIYVASFFARQKKSVCTQSLLSLTSILQKASGGKDSQRCHFLLSIISQGVTHRSFFLISRMDWNKRGYNGKHQITQGEVEPNENRVLSDVSDVIVVLS